MELYLVQHAEAKKEEEDPSRPLTDRGREDISKVANFLKGLDIIVKVIKHSDKLRAEQTAQELVKGLVATEGLERTLGIGPNDDVKPMRETFTKTQDNIAIVGHLPYLSKLLSSLICQSENLKVVEFKMGAIVRLDRDETTGNWHIKWMITPEILP